MIVTFFGSPGSGKGTQAELTAKTLGLAHVSTGKHFRREIQQGTPLGLEIREVMEAGQLVSDEIVNELVFSIIGKLPGALLDGYPRNPVQAESLDEYLENAGRRVDVAVFLDVPKAEAVARLAGRRHCSKCGAHAPFAAERCGGCGAGLMRRNDDDPAVIRRRFTEYHLKTKPLEIYYSDKLVKVNGIGSVEQVHERVMKAMKPWR